MPESWLSWLTLPSTVLSGDAYSRIPAVAREKTLELLKVRLPRTSSRVEPFVSMIP